MKGNYSTTVKNTITEKFEGNWEFIAIESSQDCFVYDENSDCVETYQCTNSYEIGTEEPN